MPVDRHGESRRVMTEVCLKRLQIVTSLQGSNGEAVPQIVEAEALNADLLSNLVQRSSQGVGGEVLSDFVCENQVFLIIPS